MAMATNPPASTTPKALAKCLHSFWRAASIAQAMTYGEHHEGEVVAHLDMIGVDL